MSRIVTPMDLALAGLRVWRVQAQSAALATMEITEMAHGMVAAPVRVARKSAEGRDDTASGR